MKEMNRFVATGPRTTAIEYSLFISVAAIIGIATLDATGGSVNNVFTIVADAMSAAIST